MDNAPRNNRVKSNSNNKANNRANNKSNNKANNKNNNKNNNKANNVTSNNRKFIINKTDDGTYMTGESLIYVIGFLVILIIIYNFFFISGDDELTDEEKKASQCPDYWDVTDEKMCRNVHRIGKCGLENDVDFNDPMFSDEKTGDLMKCKWSKYCNVPWEHIDDNC